jgi:hypothetical protein
MSMNMNIVMYCSFTFNKDMYMNKYLYMNMDLSINMDMDMNMNMNMDMCRILHIEFPGILRK